MNNNKKHRTPGPLGSDPTDARQQRTRGPLGHDVDIHRVAASTPGPNGHNEGASLNRKQLDELLRTLKHQLRHLAKELRKEGVEWAKETALDVAFDQLKDKGIEVLTEIVGKTASAAMFMTDWVTKIVQTDQKMSEEWVKARDPGAKRIEVKGGAPTAAALAELQKHGGTVWNGEGGWYWIKYPDYHPHSRSTARWTVNPQNPTNPTYDNGNGKRDDRPDNFGVLVFTVATIELVFDKVFDKLIEGGAESHSLLSKWAKKTALQFEKKLASDKFEEFLTKVASQKGHHHHPTAPPKPGTSPTTPGPAPGLKLPGSTVTATTNIDQCDSIFDGSSCIKKKGHAPPHQGIAGNIW